MSRKRRRSRGRVSGRYDVREVGARIERRRRRVGLPVASVCRAMGIGPWDWTRKIHARGSRFTVEECGFLADLLDAPLGWPFVPEEAAFAIREPPDNPAP